MDAIIKNPLFMLVIVCVIADMIFGMIKAIKQRSFNVSFGFEGFIRKIVILISVLFLMFIDRLIGINVISVLSKEIRDIITIDRIGLGELFCIMYSLHEMASIIRNWYVFGLPVPKWLETKVESMLSEISNTKEEEVNSDAVERGNKYDRTKNI